MSRTNNIVLPVVLLLSVLTLPGCASKPKESPVAAPAQVEVAAPAEAPVPVEVAAPAETPVEPAAVAETAAAPVVVAEAQPKPVVTKPKKKAVKAKPTPPKAAPAPAPIPAVVPEAPPVQPPQPAPPVTVAPPVQQVEEAGFLEEYGLWLLVLGVLIAGIIAWWWKSRKS